MGKAVRLSDIAERAQVSTVTVSKALSGQKGVSREKRALIEKLAKEMGYQKSVPSPGSRKGYTIGVIVSEKFLSRNRSFYWTFYQELSKSAAAGGHLPVLKVISRTDEEAMEVPAIITGEQVKGIIFLGTFSGKYSKAMTGAAKVPYIFLDTIGPEPGADCVVTDNMRMAYGMTNYLFEKGHERIGFVGTRGIMDPVDDRFIGYIKSLIAHGMPYRPEDVLDDRDIDTGVIDPEKHFHIDKDDRPTAFVCASDITANCLIRHLQRQGFSVPEEVSVAGFDDFLPDQIAGVGLTTCRVDVPKMADRAVRMLVCKIDGTRYEPGVTEVGGRLIERDSVKRIGEPVEI